MDTFGGPPTKGEGIFALIFGIALVFCFGAVVGFVAAEVMVTCAR